VVHRVHPSPQPKQHLDRFSRFSTAPGCDQRTRRHRPQNIGNNRPHLIRFAQPCVLVILTLIPITPTVTLNSNSITLNPNPDQRQMPRGGGKFPVTHAHAQLRDRRTNESAACVVDVFIVYSTRCVGPQRTRRTAATLLPADCVASCVVLTYSLLLSTCILAVFFFPPFYDFCVFVHLYCII